MMIIWLLLFQIATHIEWKQISGPAITLDDTRSENPTFTAPASGTAVFRLTRNDWYDLVEVQFCPGVPALPDLKTALGLQKEDSRSLMYVGGSPKRKVDVLWFGGKTELCIYQDEKTGKVVAVDGNDSGIGFNGTPFGKFLSNYVVPFDSLKSVPNRLIKTETLHGKIHEYWEGTTCIKGFTIRVQDIRVYDADPAPDVTTDITNKPAATRPVVNPIVNPTTQPVGPIVNPETMTTVVTMQHTYYIVVGTPTWMTLNKP